MKASGELVSHAQSGPTWFGTQSTIRRAPRLRSSARAASSPGQPPSSAAGAYSRMQYGDPATSDSVQSGSAADHEARSWGLVRAMDRPAGVRGPTPMSPTRATPPGTTASHSAAGTDDRSVAAPDRCATSFSQTAVLISCTTGCVGEGRSAVLTSPDVTAWTLRPSRGRL